MRPLAGQSPVPSCPAAGPPGGRSDDHLSEELHDHGFEDNNINDWNITDDDTRADLAV
jgi:hypothetical protein